MKMMATVVGGRLDLDAPIELPDTTRVSVTVESVPNENATCLEAWEAWRKSLLEDRVDSGGVRFTRDELYDRN